jgi:hypothetical protein
MQAFFCKNCPLAFEIGDYSYWSLRGSTDQLVCTNCGVMHKLDFEKSADATDYNAGITKFYSLPKPIRSISLENFGKTCCGENIDYYVLPYANDDWIEVKTFRNRQTFETLPCNYCGVTGKLISLEKPTNEDGSWPIFRNKAGNEVCPICDEPIECLYDITVN